MMISDDTFLNPFVVPQVFKLEGSTDCYLFSKPGYGNWAIWSDLNGEKRFIRSGSAGLRCTARPESKFSKRCDINNWQFNKAGEDEEEDWKEGGVVVRCTVHDQSTA